MAMDLPSGAIWGSVRRTIRPMLSMPERAPKSVAERARNRGARFLWSIASIFEGITIMASTGKGKRTPPGVDLCQGVAAGASRSNLRTTARIWASPFEADVVQVHEFAAGHPTQIAKAAAAGAEMEPQRHRLQPDVVAGQAVGIVEPESHPGGPIRAACTA